MTPRRAPLFVARQSYRRRRLVDAVRLVPVLGAILFLMPVLGASEEGASTVRGGVYLFLVWLALIALAAILTRYLGDGTEDDRDDPGRDVG